MFVTVIPYGPCISNIATTSVVISKSVRRRRRCSAKVQSVIEKMKNPMSILLFVVSVVSASGKYSIFHYLPITNRIKIVTYLFYDQINQHIVHQVTDGDYDKRRQEK